MHIVVIFITVGRYHAARLQATYASCRERGWKLTAIQVTDDPFEHPWGDFLNESPVPVETLLPVASGSYNARRDAYSNVAGAILKKRLDELKPDAALLPSYALPAARAGAQWCRRHNVAGILMSDSKQDDAPRSWWREKIKERIIRQYDAALVAGEPHKDYLVKLGMSPDSIFFGYDVVGNDAFHPGRIRHLPRPVDKPYFLAINRFVPKKNLPFLISAYGAYRRAVGAPAAWELVLCGDGALRQQIEEQIVREELTEVIHLPGFLQQDELLPYYAHAKYFIHASLQDQWGLVVNEAMAAGVPVLVSDHCGCFGDLVIEGVTGFGFNPRNANELTHSMIKMSSGEVDLKAMGEAALAHIQKYSPDYFAQGLRQAVEYATARANARRTKA